MKQRYILPALLLLCSACQQEEWAQPEADSPDAIHFAAPVITVEKLTRSTFHDAFPHRRHVRRTGLLRALSAWQ